MFSVGFILFLCVAIFKVIDNTTEQLAVLSLFIVSTIRILPSVSAVNGCINYLKIFQPALRLIAKDYEKFNLQKKINKQAEEKKEYKKS